MKNHHEVGHFKNRLMIVLLSLFAVTVMVGQSFAATTCSTCHGMPPLDSADGSRVPATGAFRGNHQIHMGGSADPAECTKCHGNSGYTTDHAATSGNMIKINININGSPLTGSYSKGSSFAQTATPTMGNCSNVNCHFERNTSDRTPAPVWGSNPPLTNCNSCHTTPRGASGSHAKHEAAYGGAASCSQCHPNYGTTSFNHATSAGKHKIVLGSFLTYSGGTTTSWLPSQAKAFGSCRATACHDTGRNNPRTPVWGTSTAACATCHDAAPATFSHSKHLTGLAAGFNRNALCADCHKGYVQGTTTTADHIDGNVDVYYSTQGDLGYTANKAKGSAVSSCSTAYCHSNGRSTFTSPTWGGSSTGCNFCHPNLSAKHASHVNLSALATATYGSTADNSAGTIYDFGCGNCHPTSVSSHLNGAVDLTLNNTQGGTLKSKNNVAVDNAGYTQNAGVSVTCAAAYCHSNGMAAPTFYGADVNWYETAYVGDKCARCHGNSPNNGKIGSNAHGAHVVAIHADDIFNGVSRKLPKGGGETVNAAHGRNSRSTTLNCNICHAATVTSSANDKNSACSGCHDGNVAPLKGDAIIADTSKHVNGTVDVNFINQKIVSKAQVTQTAFAAYTAAASGGWIRNKGIYKTYTSGYDVTRSILSASPAYSVAGCAVACHGNISVKWTDTVTCTSCHTRLK